MIRGIGTDIIEIDRISRAVKKDYFLKRAFSEGEIVMAKERNTDVFLAGNFAVKEAFVKALGIGFRGIGLKDLEVLRDKYGKEKYLCIYKQYKFISRCNGGNRS